jgi:tetratricopeptide (TPR) repeat protein
VARRTTRGAWPASNASCRFALAYVVHDVTHGIAFIDRAVALNPNLAWAWLYSGWARIWLGQPDAAIEHFAHAMRLSPLDPLIADVQAATAHAHFFVGRYEEAASWADMAVDARTASYVAAAANGLAGHLEEARQAVARLQQRDPTPRISTVRDALGPHRPEDLAKYEAGLRQAGLPE